MIIKAKAVFAQTDLKVGTSPGLITPSAVFEASSTNKGILIPRMTTAQMNAISSPANGLMIFNTDKGCMHLYNGVSWRNLCLAVSDSAWSLLGNSGTVDGTNFIGTTDNIPFNIRVNNQKAGRVASNGVTLFGYQAGNANTTMNTLTAYGYQAGFSNTTALNGYFSGYQAGYSNTTGNYNYFSGYQAGYSNTTGTYNHFSGYQAGYSNNGSRNTFIGPLAGQSTTTNDNTAIGYVALRNNTTGFYNIAVGGGALGANTTGSYLVAMGYNALGSNTTGTENTGLGHVALSSNTTGGANTALGSNSLRNNTTGGYNTAMGYRSLVSNTIGNNNVGIGYSALDANLDGHSNTAIGVSSMITNTSGNTNTAVGRGSLYYNTTGVSNNALGADALYNGTTGSYNIGIGQGVAYYNQTGNNNIIIGHQAGRGTTTNSFSNGVFIGYQAGYNNGAANNNNFIGYQSGLNNTTGTNNSFIGYLSGNTNTTGSNNTLLGYNSNVAAVALTNATAIGANAMVGASNSLVLGGTGASAVNVGINTTTPQYKLDIDANNGSTGNPLRLLGLQSGATTDSILTSASGVVRRLSITDVVSAGSNSWSLIGNGGTAAGTNFLGTTDSQALVIKTFNTEKMRITPLGNVGIGTSTPNQQLEITAAFRMPNTTSATTGVIYKDNLPFIHNYKPSANDGNNTFIGLDAGNFTMSSATSTQASNNTGVGASVLKALTTGFGNTAIGRNALTATTAGAVNVAIGNNALAATTTGSTNVAIGGSALELNTTGSGNVAIGFATLSNSTTTSTNTAVGMTALRYNTSGTSNTAVGNGALTSNTTGNTNTAVGESALYNNTIGIGNSAFGQSALSATTSGSYNTAFGLSSLQANTTGAYNIAMGYGSMVNNSTGSYNVSLGTNSFTNLGSSNNVGVGYQAGNATVSGGNNTFLGYQTGLTNASGSSNTLVGYRANVSTAALTNATALGANAIVGASNSLVLGGTGTSAVNVGINTTTPQYKLDIDANAGSGNPLRLLGLQAGASTDSILTSASGVVRRMSFSQMSSNTSWALLGNSGTVDGTNFIGTTDNVPLNFRVNNQKSGRISNNGASGETFLGYRAGDANISAFGATYFGYQAGLSTTAANNAFFGYNSGLSNITGQNNSFFGVNSGVSTTASDNTFIGHQSGFSNTAGTSNTFVGSKSGYTNAMANANSFFGFESGYLNTIGADNTFLGYQSGRNNIVGLQNVYVGMQTAQFATGSYNNLIGYQAGRNITGDKNNLIGHSAGLSITNGSWNIALGHEALYSSTTALNNTALGYRAAFYNTTGNGNIAVGGQALYNNTTGVMNVSVGYNSGYSNTGSYNTFIGHSADGLSNITNATAIGYNAVVGASNSLVLGGTGTSAVNVGINTITPQYKLDIDANAGGTGNPLRLLGLQAGATTDSILTSASGVVRRMSFSQMSSNTSWVLLGNSGTVDGTNFIGTTDNVPLNFRVNNQRAGRITNDGITLLGYQAGNATSNTSSTNLTALGYQSGYSNTTGLYNYFGGYQSGYSNTTGSYNHFVGYLAGYSNTTGANNQFIGYRTGYSNTTGSGNLFLGVMSGANNATGNYNTFLGHDAGRTNTTGSSNLFFGQNAGSNNTVGNENLYMGHDAGFANIGNYNIMIGNSAGSASATTNNTVMIGYRAGYSNLGNDNQFMGYRAGFSNTTGINNSFIGYQSGSSNITGSNNTLIGYASNVSSSSLNNAIAIGANAIVGASNSLVLGGTGTSAVNVGINTTTPQYKLDIDANAGGTGNPLRLLGLQAGASTDSILTSASGVVRRMSFSQLTNGNFWKLGGNTEGILRNIGTTDNYALPIITNNVERMRITETGNIGIGTNSPAYKLDINGTTLLRNGNMANGTTLNQLLLGWNGASDYLHAIKTRHNSGSMSGNAIDFYVWRQGVDGVNNTVGTEHIMTLDGNVGGSVGIGTTTPLYKLDIDADNGSTGNPLRLLGLQAGATTDSILTSASGVVRRMSMSQLGNGNFWKLGGNTESALRNLGTTNNYALPFITNNTERMRITETGNVGIGTTNPVSKLSIVNDGGPSGYPDDITIFSYGTSVNPGHDSYSARGTASAPLNLQNGDPIGRVVFNGYYNGGFNNASMTGMQAFYRGSGTDVLTSLHFLTSGQYNMTLDQTGKLGIGTTTPAYKLDVVGSDPLRLIGLNAGATTDSILTSASGVVRRMSMNQLGNGNFWKLGGNTEGVIRNLGTTDNVALPFITNNTERMRIMPDGKIGVGTNNPDTHFNIVGGDVAIGKFTGTITTFPDSSNKLFFRGDRGNNSDDMYLYAYYQPGELSSLRINVGDNGATAQDFLDIGSSDYANLRWYNWMTVRANGVGIGTTAPAYKLDIVGSDPLRLIGLNAGATTDSILTSASGVVRRMAFSQLANNSSWSLLGNSGTVDGTNFLGTTDNVALNFRANNQKAGRIGITNRETFFGYQSGNSNTFGTNNTAFGYQSLFTNTTGQSNTAIGYQALYSGFSTSRNTAIGFQALYSNSTGSGNTSLGAQSMYLNGTGFENVSIGDSSLYNNGTGGQNVSIGKLSMLNNSTGQQNVVIGYRAGQGNVTGANNTLIGTSADVTGILTNATAIGNGAVVDASNKIRLGNTSVTLVETYGSIVTISDLRLKKNITDNGTGLKFIKDLRPVHYELKDTAHKGIIYDGFIAQEIEGIMKKYNLTFSGLSKPTTEGGHYTVNYATFVVPLVNAVKELDVKNEQLADENARLKAEVEKMKAENATLKTSIDKNTKDIEAIKAMLEAKNK